MVIRIDPENNEVHALFDLVDLTGKRVFEIGSGDGRLTRRYAGMAAHITAVEPFSDSIIKVQEDLTEALRERVEFHNTSFEEFAAASKSSVFDAAILSWSL
jgi:16S rRNA A1518/A1519 N6-dimethyltransferase RsmA/KsgA/DIM1 with predicted DNA glycosylase/AP lyase activity